MAGEELYLYRDTDVLGIVEKWIYIYIKLYKILFKFSHYFNLGWLNLLDNCLYFLVIWFIFWTSTYF